jgi:pyruvate dehydrogenase E2 component (dihydrolipoamide acetyltransferase)
MAVEILMPALSPTMEEGTLTKWLVSEGDTVQSGDLLAEIETDKATMEFEAVDEGTIGKILISEGSSNVKVNSVIAILLEDSETLDATIENPMAQTTLVTPKMKDPIVNISIPNKENANQDSRIFASPIARRIAADKGIDLAVISGTGPRGRVIKADLDHGSNFLHDTISTANIEKSNLTDGSTTKKLYLNREHESVPLSGMRKIIAARVTEAKQTIPHFYLRREVRLDELLVIRTKINKSLEARKIKISVNDFIIKACALALQATPTANSVWAGDSILQMRAADIAVAVAVDGGLLTPVLLDVENKLISQISIEMRDLADRARNQKLAPHEYQGGSFAISNLGMMGIESFDAIINPPHAAILAVGVAKKRPSILDDGNLGVATMMSVTMSVDHRVIDGALGAELLGKIVAHLENPAAMLA